MQTIVGEGESEEGGDKAGPWAQRRWRNASETRSVVKRRQTMGGTEIGAGNEGGGDCGVGQRMGMETGTGTAMWRAWNFLQAQTSWANFKSALGWPVTSIGPLGCLG
uniref:Uncharacterized protein n=1 Tax=Oryza glaberrima TaxID=4538 RepID=I1PDR0_ORYGL